MTPRFVSGLICSMILLAALPAFGADAGQIDEIYIVAPEWEGATNADGTGLYFEIIKAVYEPMGIRLKHEILPWKRCVLMIKEHKADAFPGAYYTVREGVDDLFPRYPIDTEVTSVVSKKGTVDDWKGQESIAGQKCLWLRGYNYHHYLEVDVDFDEVDAPGKAWELIDAGRFKFYINALADIRDYMSQNKVDKSRYDIHPVIKKNLYLRFANTDKSGKLIEVYDQRIPKLLASGELKALFDKWDTDMIAFEPRDVP